MLNDRIAVARRDTRNIHSFERAWPKCKARESSPCLKKALAARVAEVRIENQLLAAMPVRLFAHRVDQRRAKPGRTHTGRRNQIVDVEETTVNQILLEAVARQADSSR